MAVPRWPEDWSERKLGQGCPICPALGQGDNEVWVGVIEGTWSEVFLERRTPVPGYCIVAWKRGHVSEPTELPPDDAYGYWRDVLEVGRAVLECFQPIKLNYMLLGNTVPHLHIHIVPRYVSDPAPAGPIPWDTIFSSEKLDEAELRRQATDLRRALEARSFASEPSTEPTLWRPTTP